MTIDTPAMDRVARGDRSDARDRVLTIALGDLDRSGERIFSERFRGAAYGIASHVRQCGGTVYAVTFGYGVGSDGVNDGVDEQSAIILAGNVRDVARLRRMVAAELRWMGGTSACFALDGAHEPVFDTANGDRPKA